MATQPSLTVHATETINYDTSGILPKHVRQWNFYINNNNESCMSVIKKYAWLPTRIRQINGIYKWYWFSHYWQWDDETVKKAIETKSNKNHIPG